MKTSIYKHNGLEMAGLRRDDIIVLFPCHCSRGNKSEAWFVLGFSCHVFFMRYDFHLLLNLTEI